MVAMPFYGDQFHNAAMLAARGVAEIISYSELNEHNLRQAVNRVCGNPRYTAILLPAFINSAHTGLSRVDELLYTASFF